MTAEGAKYLIITHDDFYDAIQPLREWKHKKGLQTKVVRLTDIGATPSDTATIKQYIVNAYNTWQPRPSYILLVGGPNLIYPCMTSYDELSGIDDYYADISGDYLTELCIGRFPCSTSTHCSTIVAKSLAYERIPYLYDTLWYKKGTGIVREDYNYYPPTTHPDTVYWNNVRYVFGLWQNAGYIHIDSFSKLFGNTGTDIINAINDGRAFVLFRGRSVVNWWNPFVVDPNATSNGNKLPIVVSGCNSTVDLIPPIWFPPYPSYGYQGDRFLNAGNPQNIKGAVAYFGTTFNPLDDEELSPGLAVLRSRTTSAFFRSILEDGVYKLGDAVKRAKFVIDSSPPPYYNPRRYLEWVLLGDPELNLWTAVPKPMLVTYEKYISPGEQSYTVNVRDSATQNGIANALVCVMMPNDQNVYHSGYTDGFGNITFDIKPTQVPDSMWITVTARNYHPYEGKCNIFYLASEQGTLLNQGKHLVRKPNSSELHMIHEYNNRIMYSNSSNWGQTWSTPEIIGMGRYPCIALGPMGATPWVLWYNRGYYDCAIRRPNGTWKIRSIFVGEESEHEWSVGPSLVMATLRNEEGDLGYAVVTDYYERIRIIPFDSIQNYCEEIIIDDYYPCLAPSISITPKDLLHVVWQRGVDDEGKIYYTTTVDGFTPDTIRNGYQPNWSEPFNVSYAELYPTEPASNPSTEAYGEYVYVAWRGPFDENNQTGEIWRRKRWLENNPEEWYSPENKSQTPNNESNYPVMYTNFVTVWHEQVSDTNWDIWGKFEAEDNSQPFFETDKSSKYPHIDGYWVPGLFDFFCNTIWTEEIAPSIYEVKYGRREYIPRKDFSDIPCYYAVETGDSIASPYCTHRDGYFRYEPYSIDYGNQKLKYKLPYLNPQYYYDLQAITYRTGQNNWTQQFWTDSTLTGTLSIRPNRPETLTIRIPQALYAHDAKILQDIKKTIGNWAVVADLKLYQIEQIENKGNSGIQSENAFSIQKPLLYQSFPNPFKSRTIIRYSLNASSKVTLTIYDISGRAIRTLVNENKEPGLYTISWDGNDNNNRSLAQGVYFYRLKIDNFSYTKRMVLIR